MAASSARWRRASATYYLNEQVKAIQKELGDGEEGADLEEIDKKIKGRQDAQGRHARRPMLSSKKLKLMSPMSAEATVVRNYIDTFGQPALGKKTKIKHDLANAEAVLNEDHFGLEKVKERILSTSRSSSVDKVKAPILCLVGPPGVGKTSLGQSIARATERKFVRMALGGVRDEAEIRGHRRTYIGSMPGKGAAVAVQGRHAQSALPARRDRQAGLGLPGRSRPRPCWRCSTPSKHTFSDHYVEVDFDLSDVMFVATSIR